MLDHKESGLLSMVNLGMKAGNGNIFRITAGACPELDGKNTVFGKAIDESSLKVVKIVAGLEVGSEFRPKYPVVIRECGEM
jgi:cyclophilin family peptidyl-prolyl cis-trans isomerase